MARYLVSGTEAVAEKGAIPEAASSSFKDPAHLQEFASIPTKNTPCRILTASPTCSPSKRPRHSPGRLRAAKLPTPSWTRAR
eukprot:1224548-Pyramimonas_sp.AAC.1